MVTPAVPERAGTGGSYHRPGGDGNRHITLEIAEQAIQRRRVNYTKDGDEHYDVISAFIKSIRGSDPQAAIYWLARMLYAGEDRVSAGAC